MSQTPPYIGPVLDENNMTGKLAILQIQETNLQVCVSGIDLLMSPLSEHPTISISQHSS